MREITKENKPLIVSKFFEALKETRAGADISNMAYFRNEFIEEVIVEHDDGYVQHINVHWDSGTQLMTDVIRAIV